MSGDVKRNPGEGAARSRRGYDNSRRRAQAAETRRRVLTTGHEMFVTRGYAGTTLGQIAAAAGVSVETVQKSFGTKAQLAKAVYDVTLVGDDEPVPLLERPEFRRLLAESDPHQILSRYAAIGTALWERLGPLYAVVLDGASAGERDLVDLREVIRSDSELGAGTVVRLLDDHGALAPGLTVERAGELMWWLIQPEQYLLLAGIRGWSVSRLGEWFVTTASALLLGPTPAGSETKNRHSGGRGRRASEGVI
jgi:AcrR family transcriptional regulator